MGFFKQEGTPESASPDGNSHAGLFNTDNPGSGLFRQDGSRHISLSDYISRHLQEGGQPAPPPAEPAQAFRPLPGLRNPQGEAPLPTGQFLNSIDGDLTAGLETMLPTPIFRLRVMKKRLHDEIADLRMRLNKYERLPEKSPDMQARIHVLQERLHTLEAHEREVDRDLAAALTFGRTFDRGFYWYGRIGDWLNGIGRWLGDCISGLWYGPGYAEFRDAGAELRDLQAVFDERLHDPHASQAELSQLFNRYELVMSHMQKAALAPQPASLLQRLWQQGRSLVK